MANLVYSVITSLDGYVNDRDGNFDWAAPDPDVHAFVNDRERQIGTYLYGRRMYETMLYWETADTVADQPQMVQDYTTIWQSAEKIVYSTTLTESASRRTRVEPAFDPDIVSQLVRAAEQDVSIGGPTLAAHALRAGIINELQLFLNPIVVGGGTRAVPDDVRWTLRLADEHRFDNGVVYLRYLS